MEYRSLGRTSIEVSAIGLGTMTFGEQNTEAEGHQQLDYAFDQGVNLIDTAEMYPVPPRAETCGSTERIVSIQNPYSLLNRSFEIGLAEMSIRENVGRLAYSPLALGFVRQQRFVTSLLIGATTMEQLKTNLASASVMLGPAAMQDVEAVHRSCPNPCP